MNREQIRDVIVENVGPSVTYNDAGRVADVLLQMCQEDVARAWDEGAMWAAVECGAVRDEQVVWLTPGDNPYRGAR